MIGVFGFFTKVVLILHTLRAGALLYAHQSAAPRSQPSQKPIGYFLYTNCSVYSHICLAQQFQFTGLGLS